MVGEGRCRVESRRGTDLTAAFPDIAQAALAQLPEQTALDGELVVGTDGRLDFSQLQRRVASPTRAAVLAAAAPASFLAFDLLVLGGEDVRHLPLWQRRHRLAALIATCRPPLQLVPATTDYAEARRWVVDYAAARVGVEGLVLKRVDEPYVAARRWRKYRTRDSLELLVGAVTGSLRRPERLILGYVDEAGALVVAGGTSALSDAQAGEVAALLRAPTASHPWPEVLPSGGTGVWGREPVSVTLVDPVLVVEVLADTSTQGSHLRHVARFLRLRPELHPSEISPWPDNAQEP